MRIDKNGYDEKVGVVIDALLAHEITKKDVLAFFSSIRIEPDPYTGSTLSRIENQLRVNEAIRRESQEGINIIDLVRIGAAERDKVQPASEVRLPSVEFSFTIGFGTEALDSPDMIERWNRNLDGGTDSNFLESRDMYYCTLGDDPLANVFLPSV